MSDWLQVCNPNTDIAITDSVLSPTEREEVLKPPPPNALSPDEVAFSIIHKQLCALQKADLTLHTCPVAGIPNHKIPPAPLYLMPATEQPFDGGLCRTPAPN